MTSDVFSTLVNGVLISLILAGTAWALLRTMNTRGAVRAATSCVVWTLAVAAVMIAHVLVAVVLLDPGLVDTADAGPALVDMADLSVVAVPTSEIPVAAAGVAAPGNPGVGTMDEPTLTTGGAYDATLPAARGALESRKPSAPAKLEPGRRSTASITLSSFAAWISSAAVWLWLGIVAFNFVRLIVANLRLHGITSRARPFARGDVMQFLDRTTRTDVDIRKTDEVDSPVAAGLFRPSILVPSSLSDHMTTEQLRPLILHEVAHVVRRDNWSLLFQRVAEALFFFNPAVSWMTKRMHDARETACDAWVISRTGHPRGYVSSIAQLLELRIGNRSIRTAPGLDGSRPEFLRRMHRILNDRVPDPPNLSREQVAIAASIVTLVVVAVFTFRPFVTIAFEGPGQDSGATLQSLAALPPLAPLPALAPLPPLAPLPALAPLPPTAVSGPEPRANFRPLDAKLTAAQSPVSGTVLSTTDLSVTSWTKLIAVAAGISSDGDKARVLVSAAERMPDDERVYGAFLSAAQSVRSSGDASRVLLALLRRTEIRNLSFERVLAGAKSIRSSGDEARVILAIIREAPPSLVRTESFREVALANLPSSTRERVVRELAARN